MKIQKRDQWAMAVDRSTYDHSEMTSREFDTWPVWDDQSRVRRMTTLRWLVKSSTHDQSEMTSREFDAWPPWDDQSRVRRMTGLTSSVMSQERDHSRLQKQFFASNLRASAVANNNDSSFQSATNSLLQARMRVHVDRHTAFPHWPALMRHAFTRRTKSWSRWTNFHPENQLNNVAVRQLGLQSQSVVRVCHRSLFSLLSWSAWHPKAVSVCLTPRTKHSPGLKWG